MLHNVYTVFIYMKFKNKITVLEVQIVISLRKAVTRRELVGLEGRDL